MHSQKIDHSLFRQENEHLCSRMIAIHAILGVAITPEPIFI
jgi:hypothetical protein